MRSGSMSGISASRAGGGPDDYPGTTSSAVCYLPVALIGILIGYLWAAETDDAAGFVERPAAGGPAAVAGAEWARRRRQAKREGLSPMDA
ncbi:MAG: hypothetical protein J2P25_22135, partial [Nocardiopsaceae bacterium]|nr:hypothetical protein [Nocardiopsaceae bacterium]